MWRLIGAAFLFFFSDWFCGDENWIWSLRDLSIEFACFRAHEKEMNAKNCNCIVPCFIGVSTVDQRIQNEKKSKFKRKLSPAHSLGVKFFVLVE